jgi:hypothetical protein
MPAVLLAFANDWIDDKRHLRSLLDEGKVIGKALAPAVQAGLTVLPVVHNATVRDVIEAFRERHDQIRIFHFGGHASGSTLLLEDETGNPTQAHAHGLAGYLGHQPGLVLVFLNGCCTEPQVRGLRAAGVQAVVATTQAIQDRVAAEFAEAFYAELAVRPLQNAFDTAVQALRTRWGDDPRAVTRDVALHDAHRAPEWPWILDCDPAYQAWTLGAELAQRRRRRRWAVLGAAAAAILLVFSASLALSVDARRAACRAPGLRSLCTALWSDAVPSPDEEALWDKAVAQRAGDGLRAYLQAYPTGVHADEARARLQGCSHVRVETLGPARDAPYPLTVIRLDAWPTEQAAKDDALARGKDDAARHCESLRGISMEIASSAAVLHGWKCTELDHRFACGFVGEIVCRVRDRHARSEERCHGDAGPEGAPE